ncbi:MAG TPA: Rrf2 family transcriptional regulator [Fimbriiglobus sp.]|jgi:Rrf2 family protein|nr:Rrf2 family transcriptional regulator [Fimbriiglobus sp.]
MTPYGKTAQHAIAAVSRLAQAYDPAKRSKLGSAEIADARGLPRPVVAKVLTTLSQAGLVAGSPGPGGGYWLAKPPDQITLYDVASLFDRLDENLSCPFGPGWCGNGPQCPMHTQLDALRGQTAEFLKRNTFAAFVGWDQHKGGPAGKAAPAGGGIPLNLLNPTPGRAAK